MTATCKRLELRMGDLRKQLAELIGATEPDTTAIETLTGEIRATDALRVAQLLLEPEPKPETVIKGTAEVPRSCGNYWARHPLGA